MEDKIDTQKLTSLTAREIEWGLDNYGYSRSAAMLGWAIINTVLPPFLL